jgi:beta-aspartyl-dipeptidase (metallo-type)
VEVHAPEAAGRCDILLGGGRILRMEAGIRLPRGYAEIIQGRNFIAVPGFVDGHVHLMGGGGEGGFATRTPELMLGGAIEGGVTTLVGCLGTDHITRSLAGLLAKVRGLEEEGLSAFMFTGSYAVPVQTLTGSIESDLLLIDKVVGVGEVALSDHRSSQPTFEALAQLAGEARRGGLLSGKAGLVNLHLGDGHRGLELLRQVLTATELSHTQFLPTHVNRNAALFDEAKAYALGGGHVDLTTSTLCRFLEEGEVKCSRGLRKLLEAGVDPGLISFSSDGQGSLPDFDDHGRLRGIAIGRVSSLFGEVRDAVQQEGIPLATALRVITENPARILKLRGKGRLEPGADADLVLLDPKDLALHTVIAKGRILMRAGRVLVRGTFE